MSCLRNCFHPTEANDLLSIESIPFWSLGHISRAQWPVQISGLSSALFASRNVFPGHLTMLNLRTPATTFRRCLGTFSKGSLFPRYRGLLTLAIETSWYGLSILAV